MLINNHVICKNTDQTKQKQRRAFDNMVSDFLQTQERTKQTQTREKNKHRKRERLGIPACNAKKNDLLCFPESSRVESTEKGTEARKKEK